MGVPLDRMVVWDPHESLGRPDARAGVAGAKLILWKGHCSVHTRFTVQQIEAFRKKYPDGKVIAHPECTFDVVQAADVSGSTEYIIDAVQEEPGGIGLGGRDRSAPGQPAGARGRAGPHRVTLDPFGCLCSTMFRVSPNHLLWILEGLVDGQVHNQIVVPDETKRLARSSRSIGCSRFSDT